MEIRKEVTTAFQLLVFLYVLYWTLTWNLNPNYDMVNPRNTFKTDENTKAHSKEISSKWNKHAIVVESFKTVKYFGSNGGKVSTVGDSILPSFNAWKEEELTRQGKSEEEEKFPNKPISPRRKLNYASSKCGAKILVSNSESKYQKAILNEKIDEYMLNPCAAKAWFVIELCDAIEATQIELANYELYSSSPKKLSVFWSEVYPTQLWQHLGTFQAKEQRTTQTFGLEVRNFGKFIKVIIFSHHGGEHFCPLSVFRVLGYSMVYEFEELEERKKDNNGKLDKNEADSINEDKSKRDLNLTNGSNLNILNQPTVKDALLVKRNNTRNKSFSFWISACQEKLMFCFYSRQKDNENTCLYQPACEYLEKIFSISQKRQSCNNTCDKSIFETSEDSKDRIEKTVLQKENATFPTSEHQFKSSENNILINDEKNAGINDKLDLTVNNLSFDKKPVQSSNSSNINRTIEDSSSNYNSSKAVQPDKFTNLNQTSNSIKVLENITSSLTDTHVVKQQVINEKVPSSDKDICDCTKILKVVEDAKSVPETNSSGTPKKGSLEMETAAESAALIQKESVLVKLTQRIKSSELNLNLINTYLQHLSESYRHQMNETRTMFNETVKAISIASGKAIAIDRQQQTAIENLEQKTNVLNIKVEYLVKGQEDMLKRVLELHGFFLILELIIMTTIFSIFVNKLNQNKVSIKN